MVIHGHLRVGDHPRVQRLPADAPGAVHDARDADHDGPAGRRPRPTGSTRSSTSSPPSSTAPTPSTSSTARVTSASTHVDFAYADDACSASWCGERTSSPAQLNLHLHPGETVALVGRTGAGKSTVARLLARFYDVTRRLGRIDGHDVRDLTLASLRANIGVVLDEPFLFSVSIRDNIAYGRADGRPRRGRGRGQGGRRPRVHQPAGRRLRHRGGRAGLHALGRPAPAHRHRPHPAGQPARSWSSTTPPAPSTSRWSRRIHAGAAGADGGADHADHRPPALDHQPGRPGGAARQRADRGRRHPRRAAGHDPALRRGAGPGRRPRSRRPRRPQPAAERPRAGSPTSSSPREVRSDVRRWRRRRAADGRRRAPRGSAQAGLPFAGIPHELQAGVDLLSATEPEHGEPDVVFTQLPTSTSSSELTPAALLTEYPGMLALAGVLVVVIALSTQLGPSLTEYAINHGMTPPHYDYGVVVLMARARTWCRSSSPALRPARPGPGDRPARRLGHERPAGQGLRATSSASRSTSSPRRRRAWS